MTRKPSVLVTGGAGYIGSHAILALREAGHPVVVLDNLVTGHSWAVPRDIPFYIGDVDNEALVRRVCETHLVEAVIHFAGSSLVAESVADPLKYYHNNFGKTRALIETLGAIGIRHFLFSSSAAVYGAPPVERIAEDTPASPVNPYGLSKLMVEQMLGTIGERMAMNHGILRYFNVAGADAAGRAGQSTDQATHLIKVAAQVACGRRSHIDVYGDDFDTPDGSCVRDYVHVSDLVAAHVDALAALVARPTANFTYNVGYGRGYSVTEVLDAVDRVAGKPIQRRRAARRAGDPPMLVADNRRLVAALGWAPRFADLDLIVADALRWEMALDSAAWRKAG